MRLLILFLLLAVCVSVSAQTMHPIEGFGAGVTGGAGSVVINVTNLNDSGAGSFRAALLTQTPRIIRFTVSGKIILLSDIEARNGARGGPVPGAVYDNLTIDGSTAPNQGVQITGANTIIGNDNTLIMFMKFRCGDQGATTNKDSLSFDHATNFAVTDSSVGLGDDGDLDVNNSSSNGTIQYNIIGPNLASGSVLIKYLNSIHVTLRNNVLFNSSRYPENGGPSQMSMVNNVLYRNWGPDAWSLFPPDEGIIQANIVNNYYKYGSSAGNTVNSRPIYFYSARAFSSGSSFYVSGNETHGPTGTLLTNVQNQIYGNDPVTINGSPFAFPAVTTTSPTAAYADVMANAGARLPCRLDALDVTILGFVSAGTGKTSRYNDVSELGGYPDLTQPCSGTTPTAPSNLQLTAHTTSGATLTWVDTSGNETGFKIERSLGDGAYALVAVTAANVQTFTDNASEAITRNNPLRWRVKATNGSGDSAATTPVFNTLPPSPLGTYSTSWTTIYPVSSFPRPTRPARGGWVYDPLFGGKIIRVTEESTTNSNGTVYSYWSSMNSNSTRILEFLNTNPGGRIHAFTANPSLGQPYVSGTPLTLPAIPGDGSDGFFAGSSPIWDQGNPDVLYAAGAQKVYKYTINTGWTLYADASALFSAVAPTAYIRQWQVENNPNPRRFGFQVYTSDPFDPDNGAMVFEKNASTTATTQIYYRPKDTPVGLNEVTISKNGDYFLLSYESGLPGEPTNGAAAIIALDQPGQPYTLMEANNYRTGGHWDLTETDVFGPDNYNGSLDKVTLANPLQGVANIYKSLLFIPDYGSYHTSCRAETSLGWLELSFHFTATGTRPLDAELILVSITGANVRRYAHHFGNPDVPAAGGCAGYYDSTRANLSPDGLWDAFTSDWGTLPTNYPLCNNNPSVPRRDLYVARTPIQAGATQCNWSTSPTCN